MDEAVGRVVLVEFLLTPVVLRANVILKNLFELLGEGFEVAVETDHLHHMLNVAVVFPKSCLDHFTLQLDSHYYDFLACTLVDQFGLDLLLRGFVRVLWLLFRNLFVSLIRHLFFLLFEVCHVLLTPASGQASAFDRRHGLGLSIRLHLDLARR